MSRGPLVPQASVLVLAVLLAAFATLTAAAPPAAPAPAATPPAAPPDDDDRPLDARTYARGIEALRQGRREEAVQTLKKVFQDFPDSPHAPQALLKVADLIYPAAAWTQIGSASPQAVKEAGDLLATLAQKYRSSREAPRALIKLGYILLEPANPKADLDEACARFASAAQIYPDSDAADDAYFGSGMCETMRAHPALAADFFSRLMDESPASPLAAEALYRLGLALSLLDDPAEAALVLERVRTRYPESRFAPRALERITLIHRLRLQPAFLRAQAAAKTSAAAKAQRVSDGPAAAPPEPDLYRLDETYGAPAPGRGTTAKAEETFRGASDIDIDAQGLAVVASPRSPGVFRLDPKGKVVERIANPLPGYVGVGEGLAVYISGSNQIALNSKNWGGADLKGPDGRPPREFGPVAADASGRVYLLDPRENAVLAFDRSRRLVATLRPDVKDGRFVDIARSENGVVYALEGRLKIAVELNQGKATRKINLGGLGLTEPIAFAADGLGDLFVLDGRSGWVYVASPSGERLAIIRPSKEAAARLGEPSAVAVDAIGRVYISGRKGATILRFR
ncbi:MAG TPA: tetratricopeptide repeat protein [Candidatus Polarisedimenticolia bacterium]|nr:tetratricopeptide repeat protein [Candidatus Polarisedimenticolia bacterium]